VTVVEDWMALSADAVDVQGFGADGRTARDTLPEGPPEGPTFAAPSVRGAVDRPLLRANDELVNVGLRVELGAGADPGTRVSVQVFADDHAGASDVADLGPGTLRLRARCAAGGAGRVYLVVVTATDGSGQSACAVRAVAVPHGDDALGTALVRAAAEVAEAWYRLYRSAPAGFALLGAGPAGV
jgi:hypothetical protein